MTAIAQPIYRTRTASEGGGGASALRSERSLALIRVAVVAAVLGIYLSSLGIRRSLGPSALVILVLAGVYGLGCLLVLAADRLPSLRARFGTLGVDVLLITLWVQATGGPQSEFWTLYLLVAVSAALRFRLPETIGVAVSVTVLHLAVTAAQGGLPQTQLIYRPTLMVATGFAVGVLAHQRALHRQERAVLQALADTRGQELGVQRAEVERMRRVDLKRSEYVAIAAHEFRTPLAAVIGVLSTLRTHGPALEDEVRDELIDGAQSQAERLARLVEDLLTASRIEDGVLRLHLEAAEPGRLVAEAVRASGTADRVDIQLGSLGLVLCDADAIVRVLVNLLDNARKYSPDGARIVVAATAGDEGVRVAVRDRGPGVRSEDRELVFERFRRLGSTGGKPGAGLGLYISRGLVEAHDGEIGVTEAPGGGAEFAFTLPRAPGGADVVGAAVTEVTAPSPAVR